MVKVYMRLVTHNLDPSKGKIADDDTRGQRFCYGAFSYDIVFWKEFKKWMINHNFHWSINYLETHGPVSIHELVLRKAEGVTVNTWIYDIEILYVSPKKIREAIARRSTESFPQIYQRDG